VSFTSLTPQTTWDVYGKFGLIYYFDAPESLADDTFSQSRLNASVSHRFSERVRFLSRNFVANELEPEYSYGVASTRSGKEYFSWMTDNSIGYRWTERLGTYTGIRFSGNRFDTDGENSNDRTTIEGYEQFRYQLTPQSVLTPEYRYSQTNGSGVASDSTDQYFIIGVDHRFSPNTVGIFKTGLQLRDVNEGGDSSNPYLEIALQSQINEQFRLGVFTRYSAEVNDTVLGALDYEDRRALRIGANANYTLSEDVSLFSGTDLIFSNYMNGRDVNNVNAYGPDKYENNLNAYIGCSYKLTDYLFCNLSYTYSQVFTDISNEREYVRNRISLGLSAEF
jgi:opacity protein-like surface antigen